MPNELILIRQPAVVYLSTRLCNRNGRLVESNTPLHLPLPPVPSQSQSSLLLLPNCSLKKPSNK